MARLLLFLLLPAAVCLGLAVFDLAFTKINAVLRGTLGDDPMERF